VSKEGAYIDGEFGREVDRGSVLAARRSSLTVRLYGSGRVRSISTDPGENSSNSAEKKGNGNYSPETMGYGGVFCREAGEGDGH